MKKVNAKWFAFKYKLLKRIETSLNNDKELIKNGAEIAFKDYCKLLYKGKLFKRSTS